VEPEPASLARALAVQRDRGGVLTRAEALACGLTAAQVQTLLRRGTWRVVRRGAYAAAAPAGGGQAHAVEVAASAVLLTGRHVASHRSAALVLGLPLLGRPPDVPELLRAPRAVGDAATLRGLHVAGLEDDEVMSCRGVLVTTPARTVCDLARTRGLRTGVVAADAALHAGLPRADLEAAARRCAGWPGARTARAVVQFADERAESPLESLTRVGYAEQGLPAPRTQVDVHDRQGWVARVDFLFEQQRTVGEADGLAKYRVTGSLPAWADDALVREKQREERLRLCGLEVVRNDWDVALRRPAELGERVRRHFAFAARAELQPGVRFVEAPVRRDRPLSWPLPTSELRLPRAVAAVAAEGARVSATA
jgi:hypothetical protein